MVLISTTNPEKEHAYLLAKEFEESWNVSTATELTLFRLNRSGRRKKQFHRTQLKTRKRMKAQKEMVSLRSLKEVAGAKGRLRLIVNV